MIINNEIPDFSIDLFCRAHRNEFKRVYEQYHTPLYRFADKLLRNEEAEDIVTNTFVKLWYDRNKFKTLQNIKAYLYVVTRNACIDYLRLLQRQREIVKDILYLQASEENQYNENISPELLSKIHQRIEALPKKCRKIFELIYFENLTTAQVAARLRISNQTVLNQKARAIHFLRLSLLEWGL